MPTVMMLCLLVLTVVADLWKDRIPDALTLTGLAAGLIHGYEQAGLQGLLASIAAAVMMPWKVALSTACERLKVNNSPPLAIRLMASALMNL